MILKKLLNSTAITLSAVVIVSCGGGSGNSGGSGAAVPPPSPPPPPPADTSAPEVSFSPTSLTVGSSATASATLTATDNVAVTSGPSVICTNGGTFSGGTFTAPAVATSTTSVCTATAGDAAGNEGTATLTVTVTPPPAAVTIDGKVTYDLVPFNTTTNGLNYAAITQAPAPGITVEAQSNAGTVLATDVTDINGDYSFSVDSNTDLRIVAKAEMVQTSGAQWDVQVIDNTSSGALYQIAGAVSTTGTSDSTRNLNAASGWGGSSYTSSRNAAPFAILAPIYTSMQKIVAIDSDVVFPRVRFNWSVNNRAAIGDPANGEIVTSSYVSNGTIGNGQVFILGNENSDTDEYDTHVVVHEWGHYFEDQLSRSDSIGGGHSGGQELDMRVAMGEGFGNALSGIMTDDPFYRDSSGSQQSRGFSINVETNRPAGWYDESTVQSVLYDIYDTASDGDDTISLGLGPIYEVFTATSYIEQPVFTSIFSFLAELRSQQSASASDIDSLATARGINSTAQDGAGETNRGSTVLTLPEYSAVPVYKDLAVNGTAVEVCSVDVNGEFNKLGNRAFLKFTATAGSHTLTMTRSRGAASRDPDFFVYKNGTLVARAESEPAESEATTVNLTAGEHVIEAYDFFNTGLSQNATTADACYNFTITR